MNNLTLVKGGSKLFMIQYEFAPKHLYMRELFFIPVGDVKYVVPRYLHRYVCLNDLYDIKCEHRISVIPSYAL